MPKIVGEYIDRICTVEMRPGTGNLPRQRDTSPDRRSGKGVNWDRR